MEESGRPSQAIFGVTVCGGNFIKDAEAHDLDDDDLTRAWKQILAYTRAFNCKLKEYTHYEKRRFFDCER